MTDVDECHRWYRIQGNVGADGACRTGISYFPDAEVRQVWTQDPAEPIPNGLKKAIQSVVSFVLRRDRVPSIYSVNIAILAVTLIQIYYKFHTFHVPTRSGNL